MDFRFYEIFRSPEYIEKLIDGCLLAFGLSSLGGLLGFLFGLILALLQLNTVPTPFRIAARSYVEVVRNTPFIVQLFFIAFGLPMLLGFNWAFWVAALTAITLNFGAYFAEVLRAGIQSIGKGQYEGAYSLGLNHAQVTRYVVLPQAIANVFPSITSQFIFLFLTTGLISEIGVEELTWAGRFIADRTFRDFEVFIVLTLLYMAMVYVFLGLFALIGKFAFRWKQA